MPQRNEESRLRAVVETAVDGVILIDAAGKVLLFNPACERLFGYTAAEVVGQNVKILMPEPYRREHDGYLGNYRDTGHKRIIGVGREVAGQRKNGTVFPMDLSVGEAKQDGEPIFVGIIHDLTERKRTEQALRESAERLRAVIDTAVDGVILIDSQGSIASFNPACERLFGYKAEEVIGKNVKMLMPEPNRAAHDRYIDNYLRTGERKIIGIGREVDGLRKDGSSFPMDLSVGEAKQDRESMFVGIIRDLTDRKRATEQLAQAQKMEAVGQLSGGIAHDFNNLLTAILGCADFLGESLRGRPDLKRLADTIVSAAERGGELTKRLLAFSRRQFLAPIETDCNDLVDGMRELLRRTLRENIAIRTTLEAGLPPAFADPGQLESAILNLSINAQDAMPDGGHLTIATASFVLDEHYRERYPEISVGDYVMVSVTDDGHGMAPEVLARVFEPFFTTKEVGKGSGLGLSMVYGFVKQSDGHVSIYSEPGLGTTVRMYLPMAPAAVAAFPVESPVPADMPRGREVVLLAEDDILVRGYAVSCLESLGYTTIVTANGQEALAKLNQGEKPDILFTDIVMPGGVNGWELAERAQKIRPELKVLMTSGYALETLAGRGRLKPGVRLLDKPYRKAELAHRIRQVLDS